MAVQIVIKNSSAEDKRPTAPQLANGEIALNYNAAGSFLTCKDTDGNIQQVGGVKISEVAPDSPVKQTLWFQPSSLTLFVYDGNAFLPVAGGGTGGTPDVDLGYTAAADQGTVTNSAGDDATIPLADDTNAGLFTAAEKLKLEGIEDNANQGLQSGDNVSELVNDAGYITIGDVPPATVYTGEAGIDVTGNEISVDIEGEGLEINVNDKLQASIATDTTLGVVKAGSGIGITADGTISATGDLTVDLGYTPAVNSGLVTNTSGDDATIPLADGTNAGLFTAAEKSKLAGIDENATNEGTNDGRYLRIDDNGGTALDQTVASTGTTTFDGVTEHASGLTITGGSLATVPNGFYKDAGELVISSNGVPAIFVSDVNNNCSFYESASSGVKVQYVNREKPRTAQYVVSNEEVTDSGPQITKGLKAIQTATRFDPGVVTNNVIGFYFSSNNNVGSADVTNQYGFYVNRNASTAFNNYGFYSDFGEDNDQGGNNYNVYVNSLAPNYFKGEVRGGGVDGANNNWVIRPDGSTSPFNIQLQMQSDEPTAFQTTFSADEDGNQVENTTYIGESESLLAIIKDLRARVEALEAAATS